MNLPHKYYSPGEFARLFCIDKQTLIYYDNQGIFAPAHKNEKGYRFYSINQIIPFSKLLSLRNLHVNGVQLSEYNAEPTTEKLLEILSDKASEIEDTIASLQESIANIHKKISHIKRTSFMPQNKVMLIPRNTMYYLRSQKFDSKTSYEDAFLKSAPLIAEYANHYFDKNLRLSIQPMVSNLAELENPYDYRILLIAEDLSVFENPLCFVPTLYLTYAVSNKQLQFPQIRKKLQENLDLLQLKEQQPVLLTHSNDSLRIEIAVK